MGASLPLVLRRPTRGIAGSSRIAGLPASNEGRIVVREEETPYQPKQSGHAAEIMARRLDHRAGG